MFDGPATLTMMAAETRRIRVGTLLTSLCFRQPVTFAKATVTVDHLSGGRMELPLGVGDPSAGAKASGVDWPAGERVARFGEFVELVGLLLRQEVTTYRGQFYRCQEAETVPLPVQRPHPPMTIAAHGPKMLRIALSASSGRPVRPRQAIGRHFVLSGGLSSFRLSEGRSGIGRSVSLLPGPDTVGRRLLLPAAFVPVVGPGGIAAGQLAADAGPGTAPARRRRRARSGPLSGLDCVGAGRPARAIPSKLTRVTAPPSPAFPDLPPRRSWLSVVAFPGR